MTADVVAFPNRRPGETAAAEAASDLVWSEIKAMIRVTPSAREVSPQVDIGELRAVATDLGALVKRMQRATAKR